MHINCSLSLALSFVSGTPYELLSVVTPKQHHRVYTQTHSVLVMPSLKATILYAICILVAYILKSYMPKYSRLFGFEFDFE